MDEDFDIVSQIAMLERFTANRAAATTAQADEPVVGGDEGSQVCVCVCVCVCVRACVRVLCVHVCCVCVHHVHVVFKC